MEESKQETRLEVIKHSAAIQIESNITLVQRRAWNVLLYYAYNELPNEEIHSIRVQDLTQVLEYDSHNVEYLKEALEALVGCKAKWNLLDKDNTETWGVAALLASAEVKGGICTYAFAPHLRARLHNPTMYARISLTLQNKFKSKHAHTLWELCTDYLGAQREYGETPYIPLGEFKKLMGISEDIYPLFREVTRRVIKPALAEINSISDFRVEVEHQNTGRKVTALKFKMRRVKMLPAAMSGQRDLFPDLEDIPLAMKLLIDAGLALHEAFGIWQKGFAFVDTDKRPATEENPEEAFTRYVREKIHLLEARQKQGKTNNPTGFLVTALKQNYGNHDFEREEQLKKQAAKRKALQKLQDTMDIIKRGESDAVTTLTRKVIDAVPTMLEEALEAARRDNNAILRFCYEATKTPMQNFQHPAIVGLVEKYLESKFAKQYEETRTPFLQEQADLEARIKALEQKGSV